MKKFSFPVDDRGKGFCCAIAYEMVRLFSISEDEAVGRINQAWRNVKLIEAEHPLYHEDEAFWANDIYYGHDSKWWKKPEDLKPQPYPPVSS